MTVSGFFMVCLANLMSVFFVYIYFMINCMCAHKINV